MDVKIFYQNKDIIVCEKPVGVSSEDTGEDSLPGFLRARPENKKEIFPVHRLDRAVGGIMVYALNKRAAADLSLQIQNGDMVKEYFTIVHGEPEEKQGVYRDFLFKDSKSNKVYCVKSMRKGVKEAELSYEVCETLESKYGKVSKIRVTLKTGRSHQIRTQFASRKMPIVGDGKYGSKANVSCIMLRSVAITLKMPKTGEIRRFEDNNDAFYKELF